MSAVFLYESEQKLLRNFWHSEGALHWRWLRPWDGPEAGAAVVALVRQGLVEMRNPRSLEYRITDAGIAEARAQFEASPCACGHTNIAGCRCGSKGLW